VFNLKLGIDDYLTPKTTLGLVVSGFLDKVATAIKAG
jgi:hypothetical protein